MEECGLLMRAFRGGASLFIKGFPTSCEAPALLMGFRLLTQRQREGEVLPRTDTQVMLSGIKWTQNPNWSSVFIVL